MLRTFFRKCPSQNTFRTFFEKYARVNLNGVKSVYSDLVLNNYSVLKYEK